MRKNVRWKKVIRFVCLALLSLGVFGACSVIEEMKPIDPQSATLTALVTPTSILPTLDLKGNEVIEELGCPVYVAPSITTFDDAIDGGIFQWAEHQDYFAYVTPENRYWAWFSGDAAVLSFEDDAYQPKELFSSGLKIFGDFAFSPNGTKLAFVVFRPSDKLYTIHVGTIASGLQTTVDLFPGNTAATDSYSSQKSVIGWISENEVRVATSCGIDCEKVYRINTDTNAMVFEEDTRKYGHEGRTFIPFEKTLDVRYYPLMRYSNWSDSERYVFYYDERYDVWILNEATKQQYKLEEVPGRGILQTAWSPDDRYIAIRRAEEIMIYKVDCTDRK